ncbi:MAG: hypothetical protein MUO72_14045 [Bacteroidales bacterium]|nr:hypothetical protein [Bacteroidales bacterium]
MKKHLLIIILLTIIFLPLSAQKKKDALYLKNGSIIYGKLIEITENQYKIQASDGSLFIYPYSDVDKLVKESPLFAGRKEDGLGIAIEAGFLAGAQNTQYAVPFSFNFMGSYTINTKGIISLGSGVEFLGAAYTPLFFELKYLLKDKKTSPFLFARGGGLLHLGAEEGDPYNNNEYDKKNYKGGLSCAFGTGISWAKEDFETYLSFAYRYALTSYVQKTYNNGTYYDYTYEDTYRRLEIKFGFRF